MADKASISYSNTATVVFTTELNTLNLFDMQKNLCNSFKIKNYEIVNVSRHLIVEIAMPCTCLYPG